MTTWKEPTEDSNSPTGDSPLSHKRPPKRTKTESAGEYSTDEDDSLSVTTSDILKNDIDELENPTSAAASAEASNTEKFLEDIESILDSSEATGKNLQPKVAEIVNKRWGRKIMPVHEKVGKVKLERVIFLFPFHARESVLMRNVQLVRGIEGGGWGVCKSLGSGRDGRKLRPRSVTEVGGANAPVWLPRVFQDRHTMYTYWPSGSAGRENIWPEAMAYGPSAKYFPVRSDLTQSISILYDHRAFPFRFFFIFIFFFG